MDSSFVGVEAVRGVDCAGRVHPRPSDVIWLDPICGARTRKNSEQRKALLLASEASLAVTKRWPATALHIGGCRAREPVRGMSTGLDGF